MNRPEAQAVDVVIIGGGIVGTSAAAFLAQTGASVILIEREGLASAASGANSGIVQHPFHPVLVGLYHATVELYRELSAVSTGFRLQPQPVGMLFVSELETAARREAEVIAAAFPYLAVDVLGETDLRAIEPALATDIWACRADIGYPVMPGASTYAYATLAEQRGVEIRQGHAATVELDDDTVVGVRVNDRVIACGSVLVAAGPWTPQLIDPSGKWEPIRPLWGAVVEAEVAQPPTYLLEEAGIDVTIGGATESDDDNLHFSLVPLPGASVVGSTFLTRQPDPKAWMEPILRKAARFVPGVTDAPIRGVRACPRPQSADGLPLIGAVPGRRGLYVCAGHGPWGISTGPASARLVTELILGNQPQVPRELDPGRFGTP